MTTRLIILEGKPNIHPGQDKEKRETRRKGVSLRPLPVRHFWLIGERNIEKAGVDRRYRRWHET